MNADCINSIRHSRYTLADETNLIHNAVGLGINLNKNKIGHGRRNRNFRSGYHGK